MPLPNIGLGLPQIVQMGNGYASQALIFCFTEKLIRALTEFLGKNIRTLFDSSARAIA
jgi:hypothetical protein